MEGEYCLGITEKAVTLRCKPYLIFMTVQPPSIPASDPYLFISSLHLTLMISTETQLHPETHAGHPWTLYPLTIVGMIPRERSAPSHVLTSETQSPPPTVLTLPSSWTWASKQRLGLLVSCVCTICIMIMPITIIEKNVHILLCV